jgi:hypothetical protein
MFHPCSPKFRLRDLPHAKSMQRMNRGQLRCAIALPQMPIGGPYIADTDLAFIEKWIEDGAPDIAVGLRSLGKLSLKQQTDELRRIPLKRCDDPLECLKESLRTAIRIEFFTIPPYLTAMWSINAASNGDPDQAYRTVFSVVLEEMLHLGLVSNILAGISRPHEVVDYRAFAPTYPGDVPGGARPGLIVGLRKLDKNQFLSFTEVESYASSTSGIDTIGEFYAALASAFDSLKPVLSLDRQVEQRNNGQPWLTKLSTDDVLDAIDLVRRQGEGRPGSNDPWEDPSDHAKGMGHYFQFGEFYHEKRYVQTGGVWGFTGPAVRLPAIFNMADIPIGGYDPELMVPTAKAHLLDFRNDYVSMLDKFTEAWSVNPSAINEAVTKMYSLGSYANALMGITLPKSSETYGPDFRI